MKVVTFMEQGGQGLEGYRQRGSGWIPVFLLESHNSVGR